ncbi:MAG: hypothetical protein JWM95_3939 [Gemmatimonadetes bacterium]|nr:hypothetical protein [Gemmatimonadota bacterium]
MAERRIASLFYELRAKTEGLQRDLGDSERQLQKFSKFVTDNPTAVLGALGVAMLGVAVQATRMAADIDGAARRMAVNLPEGAKAIGALKNAMGSVADESGRLRSEVQGLFEVISKQGVSSAQEIEARAKAIEKFADATNSNSTVVAQGLDQLMDAFGITADGAELALAKIASVTKGRQDVEGVFEALQSAAPAIAKFGLSYDTAIRALVQLMDGYGYAAGKAGKTLKGMDASGIRELAAGGHIAADALKDMNDRAEIARGGIDRLDNRMKNDLNASMADLGSKLLPLAIVGMKDLVYWVDKLTGQSAKTAGSNAVAGIVARYSAHAATSPNDFVGNKPAVLADLRKGVLQMTRGGGIYGELDNDDIQQLGAEDAKHLRDALKVLYGNRLSFLTDAQKITAKTNVASIDAFFPGLDSKSTPGATTPRKRPPLTVEEQNAAAEAAKKAREASAEIRDIFSGLRDSVAENAAKATRSGFDDALAGYDKFLSSLHKDQDKLSEALATLVKGGKLSQKDADATLQSFASAAYDAAGERLDVANGVLKKEQDAVASQFRSTLATMTGDVKAALEEADKVFVKNFTDEGGSSEQVAQLEEFQKRMRETKLLTLDVDKALASIADGAAHGVPALQSMRDLSVQETKLLERQAQLKQDEKHNGPELELIAKGLNDLEAQRTTIIEKNEAHVKAQVEYAESLGGKTHEIAEGFSAAANAAYGLLQILGQGDSTIGKMVASAGQLAAGISKATGPGGFGALSRLEKFGAAGSIIGGAIGIGQALFGESPEDKARKEALAANTEAIRELTLKSGLLGSINLSGASAANTAALLRNILGQAAGHAGDAEVTGLSKAQQALLDAAAKEFGVTLDGTVDGFRQLNEALLSSLDRLGEFGDSFTDINAELDASRKIFGDKGPLANLQALLGAVGGKNASLGALGALDASSADGRAQIRSFIEGVFKQMQNGGGTLPPEIRQGLSGGEFLQTIEQLIEYLNALEPAAVSAGDALAKVIAALSPEFDILGTSAADQLKQKAAAYGAGGGALGALTGGLDTANEADLAMLKQRIKDLFLELKNSPESVDLAGLSIDQFIAALLDMSHGVDAVTSGIQTAAQKMQAAADSLNTDFDVYGTDAQGQAVGVAGLYSSVGGVGQALAGIDLSTKAGRDQAIANLQALYTGDKANVAQTSAIQAVIHALRAVPVDPGSSVSTSAPALTGSVSGPGASSRQTSGAERITIQQADRIGNVLESMLVFSRETAVNTKSLAFLAQLLRVPVYNPIHPPAVRGYQVAAGGVVNNFHITVVVHLNGPIGSAMQAESAGRLIGQISARELDQKLGALYRRAKALTGNPVVSGR